MDFASYGLSWELVAAVCSVRGSLSPLECSMPIVHIASKALHDANDALLGVIIKCCHTGTDNLPKHTKTHFSLAYRLAFVKDCLAIAC